VAKRIVEHPRVDVGPGVHDPDEIALGDLLTAKLNVLGGVAGHALDGARIAQELGGQGERAVGIGPQAVPQGLIPGDPDNLGSQRMRRGLGAGHDHAVELGQHLIVGQLVQTVSRVNHGRDQVVSRVALPFRNERIEYLVHRLDRALELQQQLRGDRRGRTGGGEV
jgi:hypothetical protein